MLIEKDVYASEKYLSMFHKQSEILAKLKIKKKNKKQTGRASRMTRQSIGRKLNHTLAFRGTRYIFSLALFYLHNLGLLILFLFCVDNCFVVSALILSDSAFGWLTAKSIGSRSSSYTERCFLSA